MMTDEWSVAASNLRLKAQRYFCASVPDGVQSKPPENRRHGATGASETRPDDRVTLA